MKMTQSESLHLKRLKTEMLNTIPEVLKLPNLQEGDRLILADILADMVDEHTTYRKRLAAFSLRQYVIDEIKQKYTPQPNIDPTPVAGPFSEQTDYSQSPFSAWAESPF